MDGHVPQNSDSVILGDSLGFMLIPSFLHFNAKLLADLPVHVCSCLVVAVDIFSFSQFRASRDQVVNGLVETAIQSTFWVQVRLLEDVVLVAACWEALILGCGDKTLGFCLEASCFKPSVGLCLGLRQPVSPVEGIFRGALLIPTWTWAVGDPGVWPWPLHWGHRWCSPHPLQVVL